MIEKLRLKDQIARSSTIVPISWTCCIINNILMSPLNKTKYGDYEAYNHKTFIITPSSSFLVHFMESKSHFSFCAWKFYSMSFKPFSAFPSNLSSYFYSAKLFIFVCIASSNSKPSLQLNFNTKAIPNHNRFAWIPYPSSHHLRS